MQILLSQKHLLLVIANKGVCTLSVKNETALPATITVNDVLAKS